MSDEEKFKTNVRHLRPIRQDSVAETPATKVESASQLLGELDALRERVKTGKVTAVAFVTEEPGGQLGSFYAGFSTITLLVGFLEILKMRVLKTTSQHWEESD